MSDLAAHIAHLADLARFLEGGAPTDRDAAAIRAVLAELERLRAENERMRRPFLTEKDLDGNSPEEWADIERSAKGGA